MTWHAKALQTSYLSGPGAGSHGAEESDRALPFTTTSWYFLDAIDVQAAPGTSTIVCFGDSITDGTGSTLNGDDRWPDVLARRLLAAYGPRIAVVNAGIGGNRITGPTPYDSKAPFAISWRRRRSTSSPTTASARDFCQESIDREPISARARAAVGSRNT